MHALFHVIHCCIIYHSTMDQQKSGSRPCEFSRILSEDYPLQTPLDIGREIIRGIGDGLSLACDLLLNRSELGPPGPDDAQAAPPPGSQRRLTVVRWPDLQLQSYPSYPLSGDQKHLQASQNYYSKISPDPDDNSDDTHYCFLDSAEDKKYNTSLDEKRRSCSPSSLSSLSPLSSLVCLTEGRLGGSRAIKDKLSDCYYHDYGVESLSSDDLYYYINKEELYLNSTIKVKPSRSTSQHRAPTHSDSAMDRIPEFTLEAFADKWTVKDVVKGFFLSSLPCCFH